MLVNNIDIVNFKAMLVSKSIQTADVITVDDWLRNALNPLFLGKQEQYKQIKIQLLIDDVSEESALNNISNLVKQLEVCTIKFDDLSFYYDCLIVNKSNERIIPGKYTLDVELKAAYAYKAAVTELLDHISSKTINVAGNLKTAAVVAITVPTDTISVTINGLGSTIIVKNLKANIQVVIDGEACTVLQNGVNKFPDTDMWDFPILQPGVNTISVDNANCTLQIQYKPKFL